LPVIIKTSQLRLCCNNFCREDTLLPGSVIAGR
jgi:hypothetical protein